MFSCGIYKIFKNTQFEVWLRLLLKPVLSPVLRFLINHTSGSTYYICFSFTAWKLSKYKVFLVRTFTAWKMSKYGVFSGPYFPLSGLNTNIYSAIRRFTIWTPFTQCFSVISIWRSRRVSEVSANTWINLAFKDKNWDLISYINNINMTKQANLQQMKEI